MGVLWVRVLCRAGPVFTVVNMSVSCGPVGFVWAGLFEKSHGIFTNLRGFRVAPVRATPAGESIRRTTRYDEPRARANTSG